jgi:hypothetical protein
MTMETWNTASNESQPFESWDKFEYHELANLFPMLEGELYRELVLSIQDNGQREPIALLDNKILDGRNRHKGILEVGIAPRYVRLPPQTDALKYVLVKNLHRRHLSESQRAMIAAKLANLSQGGDRSKPPIDGMSVNAAANALNVGSKSVERAKRVQKDGVPELQTSVERDEVPVSAAEEFAKQSKDEQAEKIKEAGSVSDAVKRSNADAKRGAKPTNELGKVGDTLIKAIAQLYVDSAEYYGDQAEAMAAKFVETDRTAKRAPSAIARSANFAHRFLANVVKILRAKKVKPNPKPNASEKDKPADAPAPGASPG